MDSAKNQIADKIKSSNNILLTVSRNPSVDQIAACLGLTLLLNKLDKHVAAVFSGEIPDTIGFLQAENTIEKNTDSLRDFIISLDKSKADKLRYKVEDEVVRIFITPYKTSISEEDFDFSQGDFNVDVVIAIGVENQEDIDEAITAHGSILHDATVTSINTTAEGGLGSINWHDPTASSLSELVTDLGEVFGANLFDRQVSTALLTGIVAETDRFSNQKTTSETMRASAALMAAGADQQLVATKLNEIKEAPAPRVEQKETKSDEETTDTGAIEIDHEASENEGPLELPKSEEKAEENPKTGLSTGPNFVTEPPSMGGQLTANSKPEDLEPSTDPLSKLKSEVSPLLSREDGAQTESAAKPEMTPPPTGWTPPSEEVTEPNKQTLADIESSVKSKEQATEHLEDAREGVEKAIDALPSPLEPAQDLNAQPLGEALHDVAPVGATVEPHSDLAGLNLSSDPGMPAAVQDPNAPPSVPPPIPFQFGQPNKQ